MILRPRSGLNNQIYALIKGIIFAHITNRNLYIDGFQKDYRNMNNLISIDKIINIDNLQKTIYENKLTVKIENNINSIFPIQKIKSPPNIEIHNLLNILSLLQSDENNSIVNIDIESPASGNIPQEYEPIYLNILSELEFTSYFINIANEIKKQLNFNKYACIHLRIENDAIKHLSENSIFNINDMNGFYKTKYLMEIDFYKKYLNNVYVCTGLNNQDENYLFYQKLKEKFHWKDKTDIQHPFYNEQNDRELLAIVDYIIAKDANSFLGCDWSSFSININAIYKKNNKLSKLIDIWNLVKQFN